jgi:hypothetical protein
MRVALLTSHQASKGRVIGTKEFESSREIEEVFPNPACHANMAGGVQIMK